MKKRNIAIIPARGGSKRIPQKNIKLFLGKPIIQYSVEIALKLKLFDEVMVSTDDQKIANIAQSCGANIPFLRNKRTANDHAIIPDVIEEVLMQYKREGKAFDYFCCILPTAPLLIAERIAQAFQLINKREFDSVFPVVRFSYPIQRALKIEDGYASMIWPENYLRRSQDLMPAFHDSGQFYLMKVDRFLKQKRIFTEKSGVIELSPLEVQDIDSEDDWKLAELKYKMLKNEKKI